ncbi:MAG TPA: M20/M25/M40 family metallo-hydrolase [Streptosporangiaceae bacterium]|nr:M20/M25/M40 family metallo-hydrolase [Streptosporangiaceae bacterium]
MPELSPAAAGAAIESAFPLIRSELDRLVRIPSVSAAGFDARQVRRSARATAAWLRRSGFRDARLLETEGSHPAVYGTIRGPSGSPRILLYAHHDVQPPGRADLWESPPFEPTERGGRLFGRGTADDKAGIAVHAAAIKAWAGQPPLDVAIFVEGEEETGSMHLPGFLGSYKELLQADAIVIADCSNWAIGQPTLITSLRGIVDCTVEVRTLDHAVHSGKYGGPVPDALTALCRLISTLHDAAGNVAVKGLHTGPPHPVSMKASRLRQVVGLRPEVKLLGEGALTQQMWASPAVAVLGIDAPPVAGAAHKIVPWARAGISVRLAPGDNAGRAFHALKEHLRRHAPWNAEIVVTPELQSQPYLTNASGPAFDAFRRACTDTWGRPPVEAGSGGSLPLVGALTETYPGMAMLLTGVDDPESKAHAENESVHLGELQKCCVNEALLLGYLAGHGPQRAAHGDGAPEVPDAELGD